MGRGPVCSSGLRPGTLPHTVTWEAGRACRVGRERPAWALLPQISLGLPFKLGNLTACMTPEAEEKASGLPAQPGPQPHQSALIGLQSLRHLLPGGQLSGPLTICLPFGLPLKKQRKLKTRRSRTPAHIPALLFLGTLLFAMW